MESYWYEKGDCSEYNGNVTVQPEGTELLHGNR